MVAVVALAGCGRDAKQETTKPIEPPITQPRDLQAEVLAAYRANWDAFNVAGDPPNPQHPALANTKTAKALAAVQQNLGGWRERGLAYRGSSELNPRVTNVTPLRAEVEDCVLDQGSLVEVASGRVIDAPSGVRKQWKGVLVAVDGGWKTEDLTVGGPC